MKRLLFLLALLLTCSASGQVVVNSFVFGGCTLTAGNLFPTGNAASECTGEADATTGWAGTGATVASVENQSPPDGISSILVTSTEGNSNDRASITVSGLNPVLAYDFSYWVKTDGASSDAWVQVQSTWLDGAQYLVQITNDGNWHFVTGVLNPAGTTLEIRLHAVLQTGVGGAIGDEAHGDKFVLTPQ